MPANCSERQEDIVDDLRISTWVIYFACWPMNRIGGGHQGVVVSTVFRLFVQSNFPCAWHETHDTQAIPCSMTKYNYTAVRYQVDGQALLRITRHKSLKNLLLLINAQHYSLFQITICHLWRQTMLIKDIFHPASYTVMTVDHSTSGITG